MNTAGRRAASRVDTKSDHGGRADWRRLDVIPPHLSLVARRSLLLAAALSAPQMMTPVIECL